MARGGGGSRSGGSRRSVGGGRSTSHHRSGGNRGSSSFSGGSRRYSGGYGMGSRPPHHGASHHRPPHHGPSHHRPPHHRTRYYGTPYRRTYRRSTGCGPVASLVVVILIITFVVISEFLSAGFSLLSSCVGSGIRTGGITSTKNREKLDSSLVNVSTEWYTDELGWIEYENALIRGMENFYNKTGIQPYLYLVKSNGTMSTEEMTSFANETYDKLFTDEGHILLCYFSCKNDNVWLVEGEMELVMGQSTESIMDDEAKRIFWDTYDYYYEDSSLEIEEFYGKVFSEAGTKIMTKSVSWNRMAIVGVIVVGVILLIVILASWWKSRIKHKNKEQESLEKMLNN